MSVEAQATEGLNAPVDQNAQAAEDAKKMLAELQNETTTDAKSENPTESTNGAATNGKTEAAKPSEDKNEEPERPRDRRSDNQRGRGGGRGRGGFNNKSFKENIKSDLTTQDVTDDPVAIRKQVEFYFSDSNLPMDKFLLGKVGGSQNHPVELSILHSFKRMRRFQPFEAIVEALKDSKILNLVDDNTAVQRKEPLPESLNDGPEPDAVKVFEDKAMPRSVYVKGFGEEQPSTQFDIEAFFAPYGPTNAIRLRRTDDKIFKRSVFVEFETEELATKFLELEPKPTFKGKDLLIMSKKEYCDKKVDDINAGRIRPNRQRGSGRGRGRDGRGGRDGDFKRKRDNEDDRDWRQRRDEDRRNGFRDDKRRGGRDNRGGDRRNDSENKVETDDRGIPAVKTSGDADQKTKRDAAKADALAQARAAVEKDTSESKQESADTDNATKKRAREDDAGDEERGVKKVDTKAEA